MIITTERLQYLWAVAETGSFTAAGRRLGVSAAAVQQGIVHMEEELGAGLFLRSPGRRPELTELGRQFYFHALDIIPRLEGLEHMAAARGRGREAHLRLERGGRRLSLIRS
ncbi:helix-turn-helix domain-containing protein [Mailhella massiliensis]|uniref:helix-turn-helix domain-containing protein n=1 Tax=Mailhella massiliensis TaxID=1903261 RepID=UPI00194F8509|nr:LysR family transcriptional regulator [Mailhella massiliensis]